MRLDDVNDLVEAGRVYARAYRRVTGEDADTTVFLRSMSAVQQVAALTGRSISRAAAGEGASAFSLCYRGVIFRYAGGDDAE